MRISEILREDDEPSQPINLMTNLVPVLMFLKQRADDKELVPKLRTDSLVQLVRNAGDVTFDYAALEDAKDNNAAVGNLIKSLDKDEVVLYSDHEEEEDELSDEESEDTDAEDKKAIVSKMAKKAAK